jgi:hypothetical protein
MTGMSDAVSMINLAKMVEGMTLPIGNQAWTNWPNGEPLFSLAGTTQVGIAFVTWLFGLFFNPNNSAIFCLILGWVITGFCGYLLARAIGLTEVYALSAGLLLQLIPAMHFASSQVPAMVFLGLPLAVSAAILFWHQTAENKYFFYGLAVVAASAFIDGYVYYFSLTALLISLALLPKLIRRRFSQTTLLTRFGLATGLLAVLSPIAVAYALQATGGNAGPGNRRFEPISRAFLGGYGITPDQILLPPNFGFMTEWVRNTLSHPTSVFSNPGPFGVALSLTVIAALILVACKIRTFTLVLVSVNLVFFVLLASRSTLTVGSVLIPNPVIEMRLLFPGAVHLGRASMVGSAYAAVLATWLIALLANRVRLQSLQIYVFLLLIAVIGMDVEQFSARQLNNDFETYAPIREVIAGRPFLFYPYSFQGRSWLQQTHVNAPMANSVRDNTAGVWILDAGTNATQMEVVCALDRWGVHFVVLETELLKNDLRLQTKLIEPYFTLAASAIVRDYDGNRVEFAALERVAKCK